MAATTQTSSTSEVLAPEPSKLGTKEHWDQVYQREVKTYAEIGDEGEVWFGESAAEDMVEWVEENYTDKSIRIMDVGCGNGDLVFRLLHAGYEAAVGIDYSSASITLARSIANKRQLGTSATFEVRDIIRAPRSREPSRGGKENWDLLCDKGTYDAISLSDEKIADGRLLREVYAERAAALLKSGGILLITSCNWTKAELEKAFISPTTGFIYHSHIPRPSFTFGGASGQSITTLALQKS